MNTEVHEPQSGDQVFVPKGAIAFFVAMLVVFAAIWGGIYWLMVQRQLSP